MSFLSRERSLKFPPYQPEQLPFPTKNTSKPLPQLPPFEPVENVPQVRKQKASQQRTISGGGSPVEGIASPPRHAGRGHSGGGIIRRVSSMFRPTSKRGLKSQVPTPLRLQSTEETPYGTLPRKQPPPSAFPAYSVTGCSSEESYDESFEDIRRPSGLGSAAPFSSQRSLPMSPTQATTPQTAPGDSGEGQSPGGYTRSRAISSPNPSPGLFRSISLKARNRLRSKRASISHVDHPQPPSPESEPTLPPLPVKKHEVRNFVLPAEVVAIIFAQLPRSDIPSLARLSRAWSAAARIHFYTRLDFQQFTPKQIEKLLALLASRRDLTELVQHFTCTIWPEFFNAGRHSASSPASPSSPDRERQLRNTLLTATFTLALQRMSNLTHLTLPSFDFSLLSQHSAFGLKSIVFMNTTITPEEIASLFNWLDGQINISTLHFPNLEDYHSDPHNNRLSVFDAASILSTSASVVGKPSTPTYYLHTPVVATHPRSPATPTNPYLKALPNAARSPSPRSPSFRPGPQQAATSSVSLLPPGVTFNSLTLLPLLTTLHATPDLLASLVPTPPAHENQASQSTMGTDASGATQSVLCRPHLRKVSLNISTNLYDGLRPSAVMTCLKGIDDLSIRFAETVDRRTVEKILTVISSTLGSSGSESRSDGDESQRDEPGPHGLRSLQISFKATSPLSMGMEETLHRALQASLSRYTGLQHLELSFVSSQRTQKPTPLAPLDTNVANDTEKSHHIVITSEPVEISIKRYEDSIASDITEDNLFEATSTETGHMNSSFKFPAFPLPPPSPSVLPFPKDPSLAGVGLSANPVRTSQILLPRQHTDEEFDEVVDEGRLTLQEQVKIEAWVRQCPSLRTVLLAGMTWYNPVWLPALHDSESPSPLA